MATHKPVESSQFMEAKDTALLSSRDGYPLEPKSGLNGVKPPVEFGERTRDCSLGHAGKEGPHLTMTGASRGFSQGAVPGWVSHEIGRGAQGDSCGATEVRSPWTWHGGAPHCSRVMVGESSLKTLRRRTLEVFLGVWQETLGSLDLCP